ncbi:MAG: CHAT domain-containing protein [Bacteroidota bacterium]
MGEGVNSLAMGFSYAGAKSIVPTLWSVNDRSMSELMQSFYRGLADGLPKDKAMQMAKQKMIQQGLPPFFWAAPVVMGDASPLSRGLPFWIWLMGLAAVLILIGLFLRRRAVART